MAAPSPTLRTSGLLGRGATAQSRRVGYLLPVRRLTLGAGAIHDAHCTVSAAGGSRRAEAVAMVLLRLRHEHHRRISQGDVVARDADGVPDVDPGRGLSPVDVVGPASGGGACR
jgi:hypothetical protein